MIFPAQAPVLFAQHRGEAHPPRQVNDVFVRGNNRQTFEQFPAIPFRPDDVFQRERSWFIKGVEFQGKTQAPYTG